MKAVFRYTWRRASEAAINSRLHHSQTHFLTDKAMDIQHIFLTQFVLSVVVFSLIARWYFLPWTVSKSTQQALVPLVVPHMFRYIGLAFLVPHLVGSSMRGDFAVAAAYGDLASALLAMLAVFALRYEWRISIPLVWLFNIVGSFDLVNAIRQVDVVPQLGVVRFIPTFVVPVLVVTHFMIFARLFSYALRPADFVTSHRAAPGNPTQLNH